MDTELDELLERAKSRILARVENSTGELFSHSVAEGIEEYAPFSIADYLEFRRKLKPPYAITTVVTDQETIKRWDKLIRRKHKRPGRKRGRKY
jgi:hypothetical protein